jgi:hypothetical protein
MKTIIITKKKPKVKRTIIIKKVQKPKHIRFLDNYANYLSGFIRYDELPTVTRPNG